MYWTGRVLFWKHHGPLPEGEDYGTYGHPRASARYPLDAQGADAAACLWHCQTVQRFW